MIKTAGEQQVRIRENVRGGEGAVAFHDFLLTDESFGAGKLLENFRALLDTVIRLKPTAAKGTYLKNIAVATTMGPGIKIDPLTARKLMES